MPTDYKNIAAEKISKNMELTLIDMDLYFSLSYTAIVHILFTNFFKMPRTQRATWILAFIFFKIDSIVFK